MAHGAHAGVDPRYLRYQYSTADKLRIRAETHKRYTEWTRGTPPGDLFAEGLVQHLALRPGLKLLDVGCGPGDVHASLRAGGDVHLVGVDTSLGMLVAARQHGGRAYAQADAESLPFAEGSFDRVMANHMLYHVGDQHRALLEMRRVLRPGGRVVLTTNGAAFMERFAAVHADAARQLGYNPAESVGARFTLAHVDLVRNVFPTAQRHVLESALVFPDAAPAVRYYATGMVDRLEDPPADGSHRRALMAAVQERIAAIVAAEGAFRDAKTVGWFTADV